MIVAGIVAGLSGVGLIQALAGLVLVNRFDSLATRTAGAAEPPVTVLKPLHGGEPLLEEALSSVCRQVYPSWQVVFGVNDPADLALPVVKRSAGSQFPSLARLQRLTILRTLRANNGSSAAGARAISLFVRKAVRLSGQLYVPDRGRQSASSVPSGKQSKRTSQRYVWPPLSGRAG